jgi:hypothetical protein
MKEVKVRTAVGGKDEKRSKLRMNREYAKVSRGKLLERKLIIKVAEEENCK